MKIRPLLRPFRIRGLTVGFLLTAFALIGCGPFYLALPEPMEGAYENHGIKWYFWNWTRVTMGPYDVRKVRTRNDFTDNQTRDGRRRIFEKVRKTDMTFTVNPGTGAAWNGECRETEVRMVIDELDPRTGGTLRESRGGGPPDSGLAEHPIRLATVPMKGLHPNHAASCLFIGAGSPAQAILDPTWNRIYLDRTLPPERKDLMAAVLAALIMRIKNPGAKRVH